MDEATPRLRARDEMRNNPRRDWQFRLRARRFAPLRVPLRNWKTQQSRAHNNLTLNPVSDQWRATVGCLARDVQRHTMSELSVSFRPKP